MVLQLQFKPDVYLHCTAENHFYHVLPLNIYFFLFMRTFFFKNLNCQITGNVSNTVGKLFLCCFWSNDFFSEWPFSPSRDEACFSVDNATHFCFCSATQILRKRVFSYMVCIISGFSCIFKLHPSVAISVSLPFIANIRITTFSQHL